MIRTLILTTLITFGLATSLPAQDPAARPHRAGESVELRFEVQGREVVVRVTGATLDDISAEVDGRTASVLPVDGDPRKRTFLDRDLTILGHVAASAPPTKDPRRVQRAALGVLVDEAGPTLAAQLGVAWTSLVVTEVTPGGAAERAGLRPHDLIQTVNDRPATREGLAATMKDSRPGEELRLEIRRAGVAKDVVVRLEARAGDVPAEGAPNGLNYLSNIPIIGFNFRQLSNNLPVADPEAGGDFGLVAPQLALANQAAGNPLFANQLAGNPLFANGLPAPTPERADPNAARFDALEARLQRIEALLRELAKD
ncbi:MAG: PDZ domain-containing protein [Planctomycetota bacterium]